MNEARPFLHGILDPMKRSKGRVLKEIFLKCLKLQGFEHQGGVKLDASYSAELDLNGKTLSLYKIN